MSDGGRDRAALGVEVWKSSQKLSAQRSGIRSIAWLDAGAAITLRERAGVCLSLAQACRAETLGSEL